MTKLKFEILPEHLKLIKAFGVGWQECEFGAPEIDPKRPYGNSDVYQDMIDILGVRELKEGIFELELFNKKWLLKGEDRDNIYLDGADEIKLCKVLRKLHEETETVLRICLSRLAFETGTFEADSLYSLDWKKISKQR